MKVNLIKKAEYELKIDELSSIPFDVFNRLSDNVESNAALDNVIVFSSMKEYNKVSKSEIEKLFDTEKPVYVNTKGQIFVFQKQNINEVTANTTENTEE